MTSLLPVALALSLAAAGSPALKDGDLVFHHSRSSQSPWIALATDSPYTHVGVVFHEKGKPMVLEAVQPVKATPWAKWVARGEDGKVVVKRLKSADSVLTPEVLRSMRALGKQWLGRPYDLRFQWDDGRLYCSELVYKLYERAAGVRIGERKPLGDYLEKHPEVRAELQKRFGRKAQPVLDEPVIAPGSMFDDPALKTVFAN